MSLIWELRLACSLFCYGDLWLLRHRSRQGLQVRLMRWGWRAHMAVKAE